MSTLANKVVATPEPIGVRVTADTLTVDLDDGRSLSVPIEWFPRLVHGTDAERSKFELSCAGIHWPDLDEDISVEGLLKWKRSGESPQSLEKWIKSRAAKVSETSGAYRHIISNQKPKD